MQNSIHSANGILCESRRVPVSGENRLPHDLHRYRLVPSFWYPSFTMSALWQNGQEWTSKEFKSSISRELRRLCFESSHSDMFPKISFDKQIKDVVSALNEKGILCKGKTWKANAVSRLLRNEKYTGIARYGEYVFDNIVPQIITEEVFKEAQKELDKHRHKNKAKLVDYKFLLSEKLYCGECGALIHGHTGTSHTGKTYHYYKCKNAVKHECSAKPIKKDELEDFVVKTAMDYILSPDIVKKTAERMVEYFNLLSNNGSEIKILEDMEKEIERKLKNCLNAVANGMANKSIADMISSLEEDKAKVEDSLLKARNKKRKQITVDQCYQFLISLAFLDISKERNKEILINSFIKKVYLYKDKIKIVFYPTNDVEDRSFDDSNSGNADNNENNGGSLTTSFCPPLLKH